ncbi:MAG: hypothetical protein OES57_00535 [Acidimicrobiia bacterium]|nr:hypothetical protein [Acidimicrobiia bacterium]
MGHDRRGPNPVQPLTEKLWSKQDQHEGDRRRLFAAVAANIDAEQVLYPGSFVDIAPSFVWPSVTYVDADRRAERFFADEAGVAEIIDAHDPPTADRSVTFVAGDYTTNLGLMDESFDLLVSLYAGFVSEHCTRYLRVGGMLLVNPSHGDTAMASIDPRYQLSQVVIHRNGDYQLRRDDLDTYLVPKKPTELTPALLHDLGRGIAYTRPAFAYLFERVR